MSRGTMHAPKPDGERRRRNAPAHGETVLPRDGELRGPELGELTGGRAFSDGVLAWYDVWRRSPQAAVFELTDWLRLALLAPIVEGYLKRPSAAALSEIRMNEERLSATVVDRMRARMRVEDEAADDAEGLPAGVTSLTERRDDLRRRLA
ncbi:phage terminase small subunit [Micromonospora arida]